MRKTASLLVAFSYLISIPGPEAWAQVVVQTGAAMNGSASVGAAGAAALGLPGSNASIAGQSRFNASLSSVLALPASPLISGPGAAAAAELRTSLPGMVPGSIQGVPVRKAGPAAIAPAAFAKTAVGRQPAAVGAGKALKSMGKTFTTRSARTSGVDGKGEQDKAWDAAAKKDGGADPVLAEGTGSDSTAPRLTKAQKTRKKWRSIASVPLVVGAIAAGQKGIEVLQTNPTFTAAWTGVTTVLAALPDWAQMGLQVGTAFGVAWVAPKIVKAGFKYFFSWVDWDPLRESYVTSVASAAAWFAAAGYAVMVVGGAFSLTLNLSVFAAATALASQDLAKNLAAGYKLYATGRLRPSSRVIEVWGEKGRVMDINPRFTMLDTSDNPKVDYDRVLMLNEKVKDEAIKDFSGKGWPAALLALSFLTPGLGGALQYALQAGGTALITLLIADVFSGKAKNWESKARAALDRGDDEAYEALHKRSTLMTWIRNGVYFAGLWSVMSIFGLPMSWTAFGMTVFAAAVGFYTKAVAADLVGGLAVAYWQPFTKGDYIQAAGVKGWVDDMDQSFLYIRSEEPGSPVAAVPLEKVMKEGKIKIGKRPKE